MSKTIDVLVKTRAKKSEVKLLEDGMYQVAVTAAPEKGKANVAVIKQLAKFLNVSPSKLIIVQGETSNRKIVSMSAN